MIRFAPQVRLRGGSWLIMCAAMLWGTSGVVSALLVERASLSPLAIAFFRLGLAAPALLLACWRQLGPALRSMAVRDLWGMVGVGLLLAFYQASFFAAVPLIGVATATLIALCSAPLIVALVSALFFGERLSRWAIGALLLALVGTALLVGGPGPLAGGKPGLGLLYAFGAATGYAMVVLLSRSLAGRCPALLVNTVGMTVGALVLLPMVLFSGLDLRFGFDAWLLLLYLGLLPTALAYGLFLSGMQRVSATLASVLTLIEPLTATILAALLLGERLTPLSLLGAGLLLGAILVLANAERRIENRE